LTSSTCVDNTSIITMAKRPVELTEAEWTIIKAIWASEPCTATAIQETLRRQTQWSYSTVRTIMDRMVVKRLLTAQKSGKVTLFQSTVTQEQAQTRGASLRSEERLQWSPHTNGSMPA